METDPAFYTGVYHYRRPSALIVGIVAALAAGYVLGRLGVELYKRPPMGGRQILMVMFIGGIAGMMFWVGCFLVFAFVTRYRLVLVIDAAGVSYGKKFQPWERVRWLGGCERNGRGQLVIGLRGFFVADWHLMTDDSLSKEEYAALMQLLRERLHRQYPELTIG